jgi:hypothetical protein
MSLPTCSIEKGDLVYGFTSLRFHFLYKRKIIGDANRKFHLIDPINEFTRLQFLKTFKDTLTPASHVSAFRQAVQILETLPTHKEFALRMLSFHLFSEKVERLTNKKEHLLYAELQYPQDKAGFQKINLFIKRYCKYGLLWSLSMRRQIHFITSLVNFENCFSLKSPFYTYHELRFLYRIWPYLPEGLQKLVKFYDFADDGKTYLETPPPWESDPSLTFDYHPKRDFFSLKYVELILPRSSL